MKSGRECNVLHPGCKKFKTAPFKLQEEAENNAFSILTGVIMTGEEGDLLTRRGYISLKGQIEKENHLIKFNSIN